jgi:hypothetical protein
VNIEQNKNKHELAKCKKGRAKHRQANKPVYISASFAPFTVNARHVISKECTARALIACRGFLLRGFDLLCWIPKT